MAWITKPADGTALNTGHALYGNVLAYVPILDNNGYSNCLRDVKNSASSSADAGMSWTTTAEGYGVASSSATDAYGLFSGLTTAGTAAISAAAWIRIGTRASLTDDAILGFGEWYSGNNYILCRAYANGNSRIIIAGANGNADTGDVADGFGAGPNTLVWTYSASNGLNVYINGNLTPVMTAATQGNIVANAIGLNCFTGGGSHAGFGGGSSYGLGACLFDKELSAAEAASLHTDGPAFLMAVGTTDYPFAPPLGSATVAGLVPTITKWAPEDDYGVIRIG